MQKKVLSIEHHRIPFLKDSRVVVNWGLSEPLDVDYGCTILNYPKSVAVACNKLRTFAQWNASDVPCPEWTDNIDIAKGWLHDNDKGNRTVFCRTTVTSHSGNGIVVAVHPREIVPAPLYTKYIKKAKEFRVHVFAGEVIDVQEKRRSAGAPDGEYLIRNHANGYVFCRDAIVEPRELRDIAIQAVEAIDLDFGAVDIIWNKHYDKCYALEVNTAPGLEGQTLESYSNALIGVAYG